MGQVGAQRFRRQAEEDRRRVEGVGAAEEDFDVALVLIDRDGAVGVGVTGDADRLNADRCAVSARYFRSRYADASNDTATESGADAKTSGSRPSMIPLPRLASANLTNTSRSMDP